MAAVDAQGRRVWETPEWRGRVLAWVTERLEDLGLQVTGPLAPPRVRPWGTVCSVPTSDGPAWFKANGPGTAYEATLLEALGRWGSAHILTPLALDTDRGWSLLPDAGSSLRTMLATEADIGCWGEILPAYADLQVRLASRAPELLALGVPDQRPETMPAELSRLLQDPGWLQLGAPDGLSYDDLARLQALLPLVARCAERLVATGIPASLQHDDFHDGNIFVRHSDDSATYVFLDWGDAAVAHPFGTLLVSLRSIAARLGLPLDAPELMKLRDAYLEPWTARHDRAELIAAVQSATQLAKIGRALAWQRALMGADATERTTYADCVPGWLGELLTTDDW